METIFSKSGNQWRRPYYGVDFFERSVGERTQLCVTRTNGNHWLAEEVVGSSLIARKIMQSEIFNSRDEALNWLDSFHSAPDEGGVK